MRKNLIFFVKKECVLINFFNIYVETLNGDYFQRETVFTKQLSLR